MTIILDGLNEKQREAVTAPLGSTLVLAGAGSGKTRVLVSRIAWLITHHYFAPETILAVTFTNKAANEMKQRLTHLVNIPSSGLWVGTFHGLCHRLLRYHYQEAGLPQQFTILDSDDQARIIKRVMASLNLDSEKWPIKQAQGFINHHKDEGLRPNHVESITHGSSRTWLDIYKAYEQVCQTSGVIDFAEIILRTFQLLQENQALLHKYHRLFSAIFVDEFQDTNAIQYKWICLLAQGRASVTVVGDDDQSIYGWRGAKVANIHQFSQDFDQTLVIRLEQNYRSTATILTAANALIDNNNERMGKKLWTDGQSGEKITVYSAINELDEARFVSERIMLAINQGYGACDIAILYRSNAQSRVIEEALLRAGIAYRIYGGMRFFDRAEIKDTLAYLRLIINLDDDTAFERIINLPTRGIGEKTLVEIRSLAKQSGVSLWYAAQQLLDQQQLPNRAAQALIKFTQLITGLLNTLNGLELDVLVNNIIHQTGLYYHYAHLKSDKSESRLDNLQELINAAKEFCAEADMDPNLPLAVSFLAHASLEAGELQAHEFESYVHLMTLHSAKGLEFPWVFLVGMEEGLFPSRQSCEDHARLEEERRLCYVGMTRAKQQLIMSYAEVRRQYGREEAHRPSRFIKELPLELLAPIRVNHYFHKKPSYPAASAINAHSDSHFNIGERVNHPKFGQGKILAIEGNGAHTRVQVGFVDGQKWLVLAYANLTA